MSKLLVAYFSAEGTTRKLAEKLANGICGFSNLVVQRALCH